VGVLISFRLYPQTLPLTWEGTPLPHLTHTVHPSCLTWRRRCPHPKRCRVSSAVLCTADAVVTDADRQTDRRTDGPRATSTRIYAACVRCGLIRPVLHDLLFLPISTVQSAVGKRLITHCCVSHLACSRLSGHIEPHSPDFKREINTTTTVMN